MLSMSAIHQAKWFSGTWSRWFKKKHQTKSVRKNHHSSGLMWLGWFGCLKLPPKYLVEKTLKTPNLQRFRSCQKPVSFPTWRDTEIGGLPVGSPAEKNPAVGSRWKWHGFVNGDWTKNRGVYPPKWMVKRMDNPIKMDDLGGVPPIFGNTQMLPWFIGRTVQSCRMKITWNLEPQNLKIMWSSRWKKLYISHKHSISV